MTTQWYLQPAKSINSDTQMAAQQRQAILTKPQGSLGRLEQLAIQFAGWQPSATPDCSHIAIRKFTADHGICHRKVSAFPQEVTKQMLLNFATGCAAISVLARRLNANFLAVNVGMASKMEAMPGLVNLQIQPDAKDFSSEAAMSSQTMTQAMNAGRDQINDITAELFIGGEMGIGNSTSPSAIYSAVLGLEAEKTVGPSTGVDQQGIDNKIWVIEEALKLHHEKRTTPVGILQHLGGLEIAALVGAYIAAAQRGIPILVDGFITTAAALLASAINPSSREWMLFAHKSAEPAHVLALESLQAQPLLDLDIRLGEGSGAAVAVPIIQAALSLHAEMATFDSAGISKD